MLVNDENKNTLYPTGVVPGVGLWLHVQKLAAENKRLKEELRQLRALAVLKGSQ